MTRARGSPTRSVVMWLAVVGLLAACTSGTTSPSSVPSTDVGSGGSLRVGLLLDGSLGGHCGLRLCGQPFDPQSDTVLAPFELAHCCLMRTLLSTNGRSVGEGGTVLQPDLATQLPTVSPDGLAWTFHLRAGVLYAPPMADTEIVAADVVRSIERSLTPATTANQYWYPDGTIGGYYVETYLPDVIDGAQAFAEGHADHVSGLEAPDAHTLVVHLTRPTGDLGYRLSQPQLGPIPANPDRPQDPLGVAQGHPGDYGDFIVSSGPYMFEGSESLDLTVPALDQVPAEGNGMSGATLVRNPSWSRDTDPVHAARPDRIELYPVADVHAAERAVRSGALDIVLDWSADPKVSAGWLESTTLRDRMHVVPTDGFTYVSMNVAVPPLDDVAVRRAIDQAVDREALIPLLGRDGPLTRVYTHAALDSLEDNLLLTYRPPGVEPAGDLRAARASMADSRYDTDGDGRCDVAGCKGLELWVPESDQQRLDAASAMAEQLLNIGLQVQVRLTPDAASMGPASQRALVMSNWAKDFPSASTFLPLLFGSDQIRGGFNDSLLGASPSTLRRYGYDVHAVPSVDERIAECERQVFQSQIRCWAEFDQYLSEQLVPIVPLAQTFNAFASSARVRGFTEDAAIGIPMPSIGAMWVEGEAPAPPPQPAAPPPPDMPDGLYRTVITADDARAFGDLPPGFVRDVPGTYTITLDQGWFEWHGTSDDHAIWDPILIGTYEGSGDSVRFQARAPVDYAFTTAAVRWGLEGQDIRFDGSPCPPSLNRLDCAYLGLIFGAHPWTRVDG